jgi:RHS repeat-associated protein
MPDETTSSIDINGNIIERAKLPDVLMPIDLGDGGGGGSGGGGSNDGGGSGGGGGDGYLPIDPLPPLPVLKPDSVCDPTHLYINHSYNVKNEHLYYTDPNNPNIKYYYLPPAYYSIAECLSSHFVAYTIFEGVPGGAQTTLWTTPSSLAFAPVTGVCTAADLETVNTKNMKAYETVKILMPNGDFVERAFYYDKYGRLIQTVEKNHLGQISRYSVKYDFAGNILAQHESHKTSGSSATDTRLTVFTYDHRGRMLTETTTINSDANSTATVSYEYDQLGNPVKKIFGDNTITETKTYNIQGQLTRKQAKAGNDNIFDLQMKYHDATKAAKSYAGNIAELTWQHENLTTNTYAYTYDKLKRLTSSLHYVGTGVIPIAAFIEQGITYDRNGNILTLKRYGETGLDNDLAYSYNGNKLINLTGVTADTYTYDANGSMTHDGRRGFDVEYNLIDLPFRFYENGFCKATYTYLADGAKLGVETDSIIPGASEFAQRYTKGFDYLGSFVYSSEQRVRTFESTSFAGGRIQKTNSTYEINYYITDHLGSTRVVVSSGGTVAGTNDYYPFGKLWESANTQAPTTRYLFSGKEKQTTGGINYMDFGSRMYDDFLGRWFTHDPQSYKRPWESPYGYCGGNPVSRIDENGELWWLIPAAVAVFAVGNTVTHAIRGDIHNFGDFFKYMGQGALTGALLGVTMQIPIVGNILQGYVAAQLGIGLGGTIMGGISHGWKGLANGAKTFLGNFYIDENAGFFDGIWQGYSRHTWEFPQTFVGQAYTMGRNIDRHISRVDYFGGATFATIENTSGASVSLGNFININNNYEIEGNFDDYVITHSLYMHEFGHYLDSRRNGLGYLVNIGIPSLLSANRDKRHGTDYHHNYWAEKRANTLAENYFYHNFGVIWDFPGYPLMYKVAHHGRRTGGTMGYRRVF